MPHLDHQYTVFGKTADDKSLAVTMSIGDVDTDERDKPVTDVVIRSAKVMERTKC